MREGGHRVEIKMCMTVPGCGMGDVLKEDVRRKVQSVPGVREVKVEVVWDPPWDEPDDGRRPAPSRLDVTGGATLESRSPARRSSRKRGTQYFPA